MAALVAIAAATLVSEDLTAVAVGLALRDGTLPLFPALFACFAGIYLGDVALWAAGHFGARYVLRWPGIARLPMTSLRRLACWIDTHPAAAIFGSRCLPGTRVPLYVAAGAWGKRPSRFFGWTFVAVALWTPLIVGGAMVLGEGVHALFDIDPLTRSLLSLASAGLCLATLRACRTLFSAAGRRRVSIALGRMLRWEFWPSWALYAPVLVWIGWLAVRHRSLTVFTAVNPQIDDGGFVGESKSRILAMLPAEWVMPWTTVEPGAEATRLDAVHASLADRGWGFPLVAKPDVGQRGVGVEWVHDLDTLGDYLARTPERVILQIPHDGPYEAGLFYVRMPGAPRGRIFSVTDKHFPVLVGDGRSTVDELILAHPRFRLQAPIFLARHRADHDRVLPAGERFAIGKIGNHSQGTAFADGSHLRTAALEARLDAIARTSDIYFGRFDVRYRDVGAFMAGCDLSILELNGVTSEATHIYGGTLWQAWRTLMTQWSLAFAIGAANRARGHQPSSVTRLAGLIVSFSRQ